MQKNKFQPKLNSAQETKEWDQQKTNEQDTKLRQSSAHTWTLQNPSKNHQNSLAGWWKPPSPNSGKRFPTWPLSRGSRGQAACPWPPSRSINGTSSASGSTTIPPAVPERKASRRLERGSSPTGEKDSAATMGKHVSKLWSIGQSYWSVAQIRRIVFLSSSYSVSLETNLLQTNLTSCSNSFLWLFPNLCCPWNM